MIRLWNASSLCFSHYACLLTIVLGTLLLGNTATAYTSGSIEVRPMVQLQPNVSEQRVTGMIKGKEWKQEIIGDVIYWKGILKTFYVYHSISGSSRACTKLGFVLLSKPKNHEGPIGYIDANCKKKDINPIAFVLIKQRDRPGDLTFDFLENNVDPEGTATTLEAKHFKIEGRPLKSLRVLGYPKSDSNHLYFYLNDVSEKPANDDDSKRASSTSSTGDETLDTFLPLLGRDLFVEPYYSNNEELPSRRGVIWPDPTIPLNWAEALGYSQPRPHYVKIHTKLGVMRCKPASGGAVNWKKLQLTDCFDIGKMRAGTGNDYFFLIMPQNGQDQSIVIKGYQSGKQERIIRLPRIEGSGWKVRYLRPASSYNAAPPIREAAADTYALNDFAKLGAYPATANQKEAVDLVFAASLGTVLEVIDLRTQALQIRVFDRKKTQNLRLHAGSYQLNAYLEGRGVYSGKLSIEQTRRNPPAYQIIFNNIDYSSEKQIEIKLSTDKYSDTRKPIISKKARNRFAKQYGIENTKAFYVRFSQYKSSGTKFDIPVTANLCSEAALRGFNTLFFYDDEERLYFQKHSNPHMNLPLPIDFQPSHVSGIIPLPSTPQVKSVQLKNHNGRWVESRDVGQIKNNKLRGWISIMNPQSERPTTMVTDFRACAANSGMIYSTSLMSKNVSDVLGSPTFDPDWKRTPVPEKTLVFVSADSTTSNIQLKSDGKYFLTTVAEAMQTHQQRNNQSMPKATIVYGMGVDDQFRQYIPGKEKVLPAGNGGTQDLDKALNTALDTLNRTASTVESIYNTCGVRFHLIYFGYKSGLSASKVPEAFYKVDVVTPDEANADGGLLLPRFKVHIVRSKQEVIDRLNTLLPVGM